MFKYTSVYNGDNEEIIHAVKECFDKIVKECDRKMIIKYIFLINEVIDKYVEDKEFQELLRMLVKSKCGENQ